VLINIEQKDLFIHEVNDTINKIISANSFTVYDIDKNCFCKCRTIISDNRAFVMWKSPAIGRKKKRSFVIDFNN
jgi:hypothetical protein